MSGCSCNCVGNGCNWIQKQWENPKVKIWTELVVAILNVVFLATLYCLYCQSAGITFSAALFVPTVVMMAIPCIFVLLDLIHEGKDPNFSTI